MNFVLPEDTDESRMHLNLRNPRWLDPLSPRILIKLESKERDIEGEEEVNRQK